MKHVFLDTGFIIALEASDDQHHTEALAFWEEFQKTPSPLITTSYVLDEVVTFFNSRGHHAKAVQIGNRLMTSPSVELVHVDEAQLVEGWKLFERYSDKRFSLTDCISFAIMTHLQIDTALAFDKHFKQAGFLTKP
jgi:predicted nucleic acid-binding protein